MSIQRLTGELRTPLVGRLRLAAALIVLATALERVRHRRIVGQVHGQGRHLRRSAADKLYNEGLYLLNEKKDYKEAAKKFEEVDRQHPYSDGRANR